MTLPFFVSAEYDVDNYLPEQKYSCPEKKTVNITEKCKPHDCNPYACNPHKCNRYDCHFHDCNPYKCNPHDCRCYHGGFFWLQWKCDTCHETCYHRCHHDCYESCTDTCHETCFDLCQREQERTVDHTCTNKAKGCKGKAKLSWRFDVVTEVDLTTMELKTSAVRGPQLQFAETHAFSHSHH